MLKNACGEDHVRTSRIEIRGKDEFWSRAFRVEWGHQFPERTLKALDNETYIVDAEWMTDIERIASECFCRVMQAPDIPERRSWLRQFARPLRNK